MKKLLFVSLLLLSLVGNASAQRYSINKYKYDSRLYIPKYGDTYNPALSVFVHF